MIFLLKKRYILNWNFLQLNIKYNINDGLYLHGRYGILKILLAIKNIFNIHLLKEKFYNSWFELNCGWVGALYLNGLGFKSTRKIFGIDKKYWRFNVGHSHVFQYFTPKEIILKVKQRFIYIFGLKKGQVMDITKKIKNFHMPDSYKGIGIKYPNEVIHLKKGKTRQ
jgi:hypothetical protein